MRKRDKALWIAACALLAIGGIGTALRTGIGFLFLLALLAGAACGVYAALGCAAVRWPRLARAVRLVKYCIWLCLAVLTVLFCLIEAQILQGETSDADIPAVDCLLILGAGVNGEEPSLMLQYRLEAALPYLRAHPETLAVLCGGMGAGERITEAEAMRRWLVRQGIPEERLLLEERSTNTDENIANARALLEARGDVPEEVVVVTTGFHLYRARLLAERYGFAAYGIAAKLPQLPLFWLTYHLREFASVLWMG